MITRAVAERLRMSVVSRRVVLGGALALGCAARLRPATPREQARVLRVLTLNLAHGRGRALAQTSARSTGYYRDNLDVIARMLRREAPDIVALQEAELGSRWAGDFDHVGHLAEAAQYPHVVAHAHVEDPSRRRRYGTALLSRRPLLESAGEAFTVQARWRKGWSRITVDVEGAAVDVTCVHLDFSRAEIRLAQASELAGRLAARPHPRIVMGDLNAEADDPPLRRMCDVARACPSDRAVDITHPSTRRRLDWILVSPPLSIAAEHTLRDRLSDHRAVVADLQLTPATS